MVPRLLRSRAGFTYVAAIFMVVIMGIMLAQAARSWKTAMQREKEQELLFRGTQIRDALRRWYKLGQSSTAANPNAPPQPGQSTAQPTQLAPGARNLSRLEDLLEDPASLGKVRYLRKLYLDPMTGKEWGLIKDAAGKVIGVASTSEEEPIKKANFPFDLDPTDFEGKKKYSEWQFICTHWPKPGSVGMQRGFQGLSSSTRTGR